MSGLLPIRRSDIESRLRGTTSAPEPVPSPGHDTVSVENREGSETKSGSTDRLAWGARTDIGLVREHNEDSFLVLPPLFAVCDGMGGHAAGEVASSIAVETIAKEAPLHADDVLLGAAVESANAAVIEGASTGKGRPGMGCTASCALIDENRMAIAHVGDSRIYLLHHGNLVRLTHDHSYVEELVDAGEITADEARVHPSRSIITRALGSDPDMYADHFSLDVTVGDRVIVCSDGLSSMVDDGEIESIAVSSASPQSAADNLTAAALAAGGHDNVSVVVVDVLDDGLVSKHRAMRRRLLFRSLIAIAAVLVAAAVALAGILHNSWYLGDNNGTVGIYQGINSDFLGMRLSTLVGSTSVQVTDLPETVQDSLRAGLRVASESEAEATVNSYRDQIDQNKSNAAIVADRSQAGTDTSTDNPAVPEGDSSQGSGGSSSDARGGE